MKNDASDFGNPWSDEDGSSGGFAPSPEFENPWADAGATGDATGAGVGATATTTGSDSAGSPDKEESSSAASKVPAILLVIALIIVGIWAATSISSAKEEIAELKEENSRLAIEANKVPELEEKRDRVLIAFRGIDPCSIKGHGTPRTATWDGFPEMGMGCIYRDGDQSRLAVTVATGEAIPYAQSLTNYGTEGYLISTTHEGMAIYVWSAGVGLLNELHAQDILESLTK